MINVKSTIIRGEDLITIKDNARKAWLGGKSNVRRPGRRESFGLEDQFVGQCGELALAKYFERTETYFTRREEINIRPWEGDDGSDLSGHPIDVKTSLMRKSQDPFRYNLVVRPKERHENNSYVLALIPRLTNEECKVILVGYAKDSEFPEFPDSTGVFSGAFRIPADDLRDLAFLKALTA